MAKATGDVFDRVAAQEIQPNRYYLKSKENNTLGTHVLKILQLTYDADKPRIGEFAAGDFEIVKSTNDTLTPGKSVSWFEKPNAYRSYFDGDMKRLAAVALGKNAAEITGADIRAAFSEENAAAGNFIVADVVIDGKGYKKVILKTLAEVGLTEKEFA